MKKVTYIRCPRCELNYIIKKDKFCSVCKQEMQVGGGEIDELDLELCPICRTNYIQPDEVMCVSCLTERTNDPNYDENDDWSAYLTRDDDDELDGGQDEETGDMTTVSSLDGDDDDMVDDFDDDLDVLPDDMDDEDKDEMFDGEDDEDDFDEDYDEDEDYDDEDDDEDYN